LLQWIDSVFGRDSLIQANPKALKTKERSSGYLLNGVDKIFKPGLCMRGIQVLKD